MIYLDLKNPETKGYITRMSLITHLDTVVNKLMSREDYRDNDRATIRTLVEDALKIAQIKIIGECNEWAIRKPHAIPNTIVCPIASIKKLLLSKVI